MKRKLLLLLSAAVLLFVTAGYSFAEEVDAARAEQVARSFFKFDPVRSKRNLRLRQVENGFLAATKSNSPAFFVFERIGGGFVIISGDDRSKPVLGYSFTNYFFDPENMPESASEFFEDLEHQIAFTRTLGGNASREARDAWAIVESPTKASNAFASKSKLETPTWGQNAPFNDLAPTVDGKKAVAGCVPLAMSMICRFYSYPAKGTGTLDSYTYNSDKNTTQRVDGFELGHEYQWDKIRMEYNEGEYSDEEAAAVARLVYDCGVMVQAKYDASTSANTGGMVSAAIEHLGFDAGATIVNRGFYTDDIWTGMLENELNVRPVLYSARREGDYGHTFLLDGYDDKDNFSINWGWKGTGNGYYALSSFAYSPDRAYLFNHSACFGLKPDEGGVSEPYLFLYSSKSSSSGTEYTGLTPSIDPIVPRSNFTMKVGALSNGGNAPFEGYFILAITDSDGNIKDFVSGSQHYDITNPRSWRGFSSVSCILQIYPRKGDRIRLFYCSDKEVTENPVPWKPVRWDSTDGTVGEILLTDNQTLAEVTSLSYSKTTGLLTIETKDGVKVKIEGGNIPADAVTSYVTSIVIDASLIPSSTYKLIMERDDERLEMKLKMGKK